LLRGSAGDELSSASYYIKSKCNLAKIGEGVKCSSFAQRAKARKYQKRNGRRFSFSTGSIKEEEHCLEHDVT
jgi:hypothetical protein